MTHSDDDNAFLVASVISKRFGITQALDNVTVSFRAGEVHALMGENGAGKSTLGKVISGLHRQDAGVVTIDGRDLVPGSIEDAFSAGIRIVHQELAQCPNLSVAENLSLHALPARFGVVNRRIMNERAARLVHQLEPGIDVEAPLGTLAPGRRQIVQIAASLDESAVKGHGPRVIVFDEPTSSLSVSEADRLLEITRALAKRGLTVIYVSHRMGEIFQVCDRVTVLRDGKFIATNVIKEIDEPTLVEQMIGRRLETAQRAEFASEAAAHAEPTLKVQGLSSGTRLRDISLFVRPGEVVGVGGLVGSGRSELLDAIFGLDRQATGNVVACGREIGGCGPRAAISAKVGYVPEDRRLQGLFFQMGVDENITMPFMPALATAGFFRRFFAERTLVGARMGEFKVKAASPSSVPGELSGGNQQKLLLARWMGKGTEVLLLDEPTRGIDVGTKNEVYRLIKEAASRGAAVLLVSSEMPELLALSSRVLVMCAGRLTGELKGEQMTQANILRLATTS
ncbi:MAG: sugar ABC transporter ATP-binding protein [bacterium]|nr:sugar ABC transporter ATP-binding protein [bacterium]